MVTCVATNKGNLNFSSSEHNWPPLLWNRGVSLNSVYTPYPPTTEQNQRPPPRRWNDSVSHKQIFQTERDNSFLEKLLENLKERIIFQMYSQITDLRKQIPLLVKETVQLNQMQLGSRSRPTSSQAHLAIVNHSLLTGIFPMPLLLWNLS